MREFKKTVRVAIAGVTMLVSGCGGPAGADPNRAGTAGPDTLAVAIEAYIRRTMDWYGMPALSAAVVSRGEVVYAGSHGVVDVVAGEPVSDDHLYQLSSSSKLFSSTALMALVQDGSVELDGTVGDYLPGAPAAWRHVTVRQLLSHQSALPDIVRCDGSRGEAAHLACTVALADPGEAGDRFEYNQTNYFLVQKILERATGRSLPEFVVERLFAPLGIEGVRYEGSSEARFPGLVSSYYPDGEGGVEPREYDFPTYLYAAAGLNASLNALVAWVTAFQAGAIIERAVMEEMWTAPDFNDGRRSPYALGWDVRPHAPGHRSVGHEGGGLTTVRIFPADSLAVVVLVSGYASRFAPDEVAADIAGMVEPSLVDGFSGMVAQMREALQDGDAARAVDVFAQTAGEDELSAGRVERAFNRMAYELIHFRRFADAATLLEAGVGHLSESWILHDTLGEALLGAGDEEAAVAHYRRSLELNGDNDNAREVLESLGRLPSSTGAPTAVVGRSRPGGNRVG